jgi:hypothetical protein
VTVAELDDALRGTDVPQLIERLGFSSEFVAQNVMSAPGPVTVTQTAMLWMGMPNKHDRKRTRQLLDALTAAGLLECVDETAEVWRRKIP